MTDDRADVRVQLSQLERCFGGAIPAVIATASADGTPNITYLSRVHRVDDERVALSNQFFSKTVQNLAENPRASVLLMDPVTYDQYRLTIVYERTERRGPVFERLRAEVDALAALGGMMEVFKLRAADIYRVLDIELVPSATRRLRGLPASRSRTPAPSTRPRSAELASRLARAGDLDTLVATTVRALADLFGYEHSMLLLLDEDGTPPVHDRQPRLRRAGRGVGGRRRRGAHRHGRGPRHAAAHREPAPDGPLLAAPSVGRSRGRATSRPGTRSRCPTCPAPRAGSRSRRWRSVSSSACWWSRAPRRSPSPPPTRRPSPWWRRSWPAPSRPSGAASAKPTSRRAATPIDRDRVRRAGDPRAVLRGGRQHVPRRRLPHQGRGRPDPVGAARPPRPRGAGGLQQPGDAPRPVARPAAVPRQLREPADPAQAAARRAGGADPHRQDEPRVLPAGRGGPGRARGTPG